MLLLLFYFVLRVPALSCCANMRRYLFNRCHAAVRYALYYQRRVCVSDSRLLFDHVSFTATCIDSVLFQIQGKVNNIRQRIMYGWW